MKILPLGTEVQVGKLFGVIGSEPFVLTRPGLDGNLCYAVILRKGEYLESGDSFISAMIASHDGIKEVNTITKKGKR